MRKIALLSLLLILSASVTGCATMKKLMWWEDDTEVSASQESNVVADVAIYEEVVAETEKDKLVREVTVINYHPRHATKTVGGVIKYIPAQASNVMAAKKSIQDRYVSMLGSVYYDGFAKSYVILDSTGVMPIDLTPEDFAGLNFDKNDLVRATGMVNVDYTAYYPKFVVDYIEIVEVR